MTAMARRGAITRHPAFAPLIALWFAALLGLTLAVLPTPVLERALGAVGLGWLVPLTLAGRLGSSVLAAAIGALGGYGLAKLLMRRASSYPRPLYAEEEPLVGGGASEPPVRRPLHVREELANGFGDESQVTPGRQEPSPFAHAGTQREEGFMILTPQPIHPPHPVPDLESLLDQFDSAFATFRAGEELRPSAARQPPGADPVQAFVAQQTGAPALSANPSPMGGLVPDHQAELRAALDKLARSQRKE